jgi:hypothetical protein
MMNREQIRDGLARIASEAHTAQQSAQRAYDMTRRMEKELAEEWEEPEVPEPEPEEPARGILLTVLWETKAIRINLPKEARASRVGGPAADPWEEAFPFIEHFRTEAGGVTETICVLHNGNPQGNGAIRIPRLEIKTHDGREILNYDGPVTIPPGQMLVVTDYMVPNPSGRPFAFEWMESFWAHLTDSRRNGVDLQLASGLLRELSKRCGNPTTIGPYEMWWDAEGYGHGGQGIEPDRFEWRRCPAGYALAALEMYGTANRMGRCMTDESGAFTFDPDTAYTNVASIMPKAFDWTPQDETEREQARWKRIDGQHFIRAYLAALWLFKETRHPFAGWYLDMLANWMYACHLGTAGDDEKAQDYWSLTRKIAEFTGPNRHGGRQGAHELRFVCEYARLFPTARATAVADLYKTFFDKSCGYAGEPFAAKASAFTSSNFPARWGEAKSAQAFELQLALLAMEDSGDPRLRRRADKLRAFLTEDPPYSYNWETGEKLGKAHPFLEVSTHGVFPGGADALLKMAKERIASQGPEASGANPLNAVRGGDLSKIRDSRGSR